MCIAHGTVFTVTVILLNLNTLQVPSKVDTYEPKFAMLAMHKEERNLVHNWMVLPQGSKSWKGNFASDWIRMLYSWISPRKTLILTTTEAHQSYNWPVSAFTGEVSTILQNETRHTIHVLGCYYCSIAIRCRVSTNLQITWYGILEGVMHV